MKARESKRRKFTLFEAFTKDRALDVCHGGPEPWQPVYDDIMLSFMTVGTRREWEKKGFSREQKIELAKKRVLDRVWLGYIPGLGGYRENPYKSREELDDLCARGEPPVYDMMKVVKEKCDWDRYNRIGYEYPGWEDLQSERLGSRFHLDECKTGKQVLNVIKDNHYHLYYKSDASSCEIDNEYKHLYMPDNIKRSDETLSLTYAAAVIKQERNGVGMSNEDIAIRRADALAMQVSVAEELRVNRPEILKAFIERGNQPIYDAYVKTMEKTNNPDAARSAAVDCYLNAVLKGRKPSVEKIASICKGFDGQSYYIDPKSAAAKEKGESLNNIFKEPAFNAAFMAKQKQGGR